MSDLTDSEATPEVASESEAPRRRRRGAGREAGPPPEVVADPFSSVALEVPVGVEIAEEAVETPEPASTVEQAAGSPFSVSFLAPEISETSEVGETSEPGAPAAEDETPPAPRRRRTASRPAAAPDPKAVEPQESAQQSEAEADAEDSADSDGQGAQRRRRRRGGRGRGASAGAGPDASQAPAEDENASSSEDAEDDQADEDDDSEGGSSSSSRRRRRRRRRGSSGDAEVSDDPPNTVTHVRDGGRDGVRGVSGSTRLEAKRQRRRDGRTDSRRRVIVTEAEFLARREAVNRNMVVRRTGDRTQIAVLEDGILAEHYVTKSSATSFAGNIYLGRVQNVLPSMEAAFVDIGKGRNAVLYAGEVSYDASLSEGGRPPRIEQVLTSGQQILVQVTKDPVGTKGARLTAQISLPGRFLVYVPGGPMAGISRKLPDSERTRLKAILKRIVPEDVGVIVRTAAEGATEEELVADVERLQRIWNDIQSKSQSAKNAPTLLHGEPDLVVRVIRDIFNEDVKELVLAGGDVASEVEDYLGQVAPDMLPRIKRWNEERDVFSAYRIDEGLTKALSKKVHLPSGGYLIIDHTEALTAIDVNTGKFTGSGGSLEETVTRNNLEAAEEIARQLRLRDVGGMIIVDFIDMVLEANRDLVLRRFVECLSRDRTKHQVSEVTSLGLVQLTRKRVGQGLLESFSETCQHCNGRGLIVSLDGPRELGGGGPIKAIPSPAAVAARVMAAAALHEPEPELEVESFDDATPDPDPAEPVADIG